MEEEQQSEKYTPKKPTTIDARTRMGLIGAFTLLLISTGCLQRITPDLDATRTARAPVPSGNLPEQSTPLPIAITDVPSNLNIYERLSWRIENDNYNSLTEVPDAVYQEIIQAFNTYHGTNIHPTYFVGNSSKGLEISKTHDVVPFNERDIISLSGKTFFKNGEPNVYLNKDGITYSREGIMKGLVYTFWHELYHVNAGEKPIDVTFLVPSTGNTYTYHTAVGIAAYGIGPDGTRVSNFGPLDEAVIELMTDRAFINLGIPTIQRHANFYETNQIIGQIIPLSDSELFNLHTSGITGLIKYIEIKYNIEGQGLLVINDLATALYNRDLSFLKYILSQLQSLSYITIDAPSA